VIPAVDLCAATSSGEGRSSPELADVLRRYGDAYRAAHPLSAHHQRVLRAIEQCRTAALGGHLQRCDTCGFERPAYNSCRNRHCPKCQSLAKAQWLEARTAELLPVPYFHVVFTLSHGLHPLLAENRRWLFDQLFASTAATLQAFAANELGGTLGFIAVLHTWDQKLLQHLHLHCLVPGGALAFDHSRWIASRPRFLFRVEPLAQKFQGHFLAQLQTAYRDATVVFSDPSDPAAFARLLDALYAEDWVVYCKPPFAGPELVLDYLGRYTQRVALSNHRIVDVADGTVTFRYRDRADGNQVKTLPLDAEEFIRRFLLHVLPPGFRRIRYFGFLAPRAKHQALARCRELLGQPRALPPPPPKTVCEWILALTGIDPARCPVCRKGTLLQVAVLPKPPSPWPRAPP
jgi:hypothetical protein